MRAHIIQIGNSKGIRIPKALLELCHITSNVEVEVKGNTLLVHPVKLAPRANWEKAFQQTREYQEDRLLMDDLVDLDLGSWEW